MKKSKVRKYFGVGRKIAFSLVFFLLVFAAASVVKVQAGSTDNVIGWLWGGGAESDGAAPYDGTNTNVGWISMNNTNTGAGGGVSYGVNIPSSDGPITGTTNYVWSEHIGWVSFNDTDLVNCPSGTCNARREAGFLKGWARIIGIKEAAAANNSGGWQGWISLSGSNYGVEISKMLGVESGSHTYAWSDELGWIDFGQAKIGKNPYITAVSPYLTKDNNCQPVKATLTDNVGGEVVTFTNPNPNIKLSTDPVSCTGASNSASCTVASVGGNCSVYATASYFSLTSDYPETLDISTPSCNPIKATIWVKQDKNCTLSCPTSVTIAPGGAGSIYCSVGGGSECVVDSCQNISDPAGIISSDPIPVVDGKCQVTIKTDASFQNQATVKSRITGQTSANTTIFVKRTGWVETNP
jgi:hypothetical protein